MFIKKLGFISICVLMIITFAEYSTAQPRMKAGKGVITGSVYDSLSGKPIDYATITVMKQDDSTLVTGSISDAKGNFKVDLLPNGNYLVKCSFIGYHNTYVSNVRITSEAPVREIGVFKMYPKAAQSEGVEVTAEKDAITYELDKKVVNVSQILEAKGGSATDALRNIPSVSVDIDGNVSLRGSGNFTLLIDGRPTMMSANDLLRQLPADAIAQIEIITNPSAKYDPEGTAGIMNIIMKKNDAAANGMEGFSGLINSTIGTRDKYQGNAVLNYKNSKYMTYMNFEGSSMDYHPESDFIRNTYAGDTTFIVKSFMDRLMNPNGFSGKLGLDYYLTEMNTISFAVHGGHYGFDRFFPSQFESWTNLDNTRNYEFNKNDFLLDGDYYNANVNYQSKLDDEGQEINANAFISGWAGEFVEDAGLYSSNEDFENRILEEQHKSEFNNSKFNVRTKIDYTLPFSETSKLETGFQSDMLWTESEYLYSDFNIPGNIWNVNSAISNDYNFNQNTNALYLTYGNELYSIQYQLGLRAEYYDRLLEQITTNQEYDYNKFDFFPTVHLSRKFEGDHQLQLSYSKRVQRPQDRSLNPFPDYVDQYYTSTGNPDLKPEYTDSYELNYRKGFGQSFVSLETYYRKTTDMFTRTMSLQDDGRLLLSLGNVNESNYLGTELAVNYVPFPWLRVNASANYFNYRFTEKIAEADKETEQNVIDGNARLTLIPSPSTFIVLSTYYQGPRIVPNSGEMEEVLTFGFAVRQDLFNRSLSITLSGRDVFSTAKYTFNNIMPTFKSYGTYMPEHPSFNLTFSYKINNYRPERRSEEQMDIQYDAGF